MSDAETSDREILISRVFTAPCELVWLAMTDPRHVGQWWGPRGFTTTIEEMNLVVGGVWQHVMHGPDGTDYPNYSVFKEIVPPRRLVFDQGGSIPDGSRVDFRATWSFDPVGAGDQTKVTIRMVFPTKAQRDNVVEFYGAIEGAGQTLDRLGEHLPELAAASRELTIVRVIGAPREAVFRAWLEPTQLAQWWGPKGFNNPVCETDGKEGGGWRIVMRGPDGVEYPCHGTYRAIVPPELLVFSNIATGPDGSAILEGITRVGFEAVGDKTRLTLETRATALIPEAVKHLEGMEAGWSQSIDRLAVLGEGTKSPFS